MRAAGLRKAGWDVQNALPPGPALFKELRTSPPDLILIDLGRLPSHGRDVALSIRSFAATRAVPIVFIQGDPVKTAKVRSILPDAFFTSWPQVSAALRAALRARPMASAAVSPGAFAGYSTTPLPKKLGIKEGMIVALIGAPQDFKDTLGALPCGVILQKGTRKPAGLVIWFVRTAAALSGEMGRITAFAGRAQLWIAWRKKTALPQGAPSDSPSETTVRAAGLGMGWVDFKICAINQAWSGLLFARRRK